MGGNKKSTLLADSNNPVCWLIKESTAVMCALKRQGWKTRGILSKGFKATYKVKQI